jgi:hypothetical protein
VLADRCSLVLGFLHAGFLLVFLPAPPALGEGFVPSVQPSPVEMEHVSTTLDIATTGSMENVVIGNARATVRFNAPWRPAVAFACLRA